MIQFVRIFISIVVLLGLARTGTSTTYYIKPSESDLCPTGQQLCLTLSQFVATVNRNGNVNNIMTLIFLSGNYSLNVNISLSNFETLEMYPVDDNATTTVSCELSVRFTFESAELVSIRGITFLGCGNNFVRNVDNVVLQETVFEGLPGTGTSLTLINSNAEIIDCKFVGNQFGTVVESVESLTPIVTNLNWLIVRNVSGSLRVGGAMISTRSNVSISSTVFENNTAEIGGDIYAEEDSNFTIFNSTFLGDGPQPRSIESPFGGAIFSHQNTFSIDDCRFHRKHATVGSSIMSSLSTFTINSTSFDSNSATDHGAGAFVYNSSIFIHQSRFHNNTGLGGAAVTTDVGVITITESIFTFNRVHQHGGALDIGMDKVTISGCHFENNSADSFAGAVLLWGSTGKMYGGANFDESLQNCDRSCDQVVDDVNTDLESPLDGQMTRFISNSAPTGAALHVIQSTLETCGPIYFSKNHATLSSNVHFLNSKGNFRGSIELVQNSGSFFSFNSNLTFSGCAKFMNCSPSENTTVNYKEGGALTLYQTMLSLQGEVSIENNRAEIGGAILATESEIFLSRTVSILNNSASASGGGLYLSQTELLILQESTVTISSNKAYERGGGILAISSSIKCIVTGSQYTVNGRMIEEYKGAIVNITENSAQRGGGIYLEANAKVTILKDYIFNTGVGHNALNFIGNSAQYGGAIYVDDGTNSGSCESNPFEARAPKSECFLSIVSTQTFVTTNTNFSLNNIDFDLNTAMVSGATLFGGLLDRCIVSPFNEVDRTINRATNEILEYNGGGLQYVLDISTERSIQSISSYPVQVCPCVNGCQNCEYKIKGYAEVQKGYLFNVSLIAVDQAYKPVNATIQGVLSSSQSNLLYGQVIQIPDRCTDANFQIISPHQSEELTLFACVRRSLWRC